MLSCFKSSTRNGASGTCLRDAQKTIIKYRDKKKYISIPQTSVNDEEEGYHIWQVVKKRVPKSGDKVLLQNWKAGETKAAEAAKDE